MAQLTGQVFYNWSNADSGLAAGWSEFYVMQQTTYLDALTGLQQIYGARRSMLADDVIVAYARVSDPTIRGDAAVVAPQQSGTYAGVTDFPDLALLYRWQNAAFMHSNHYLHGLPEDCHTGAAYTPTVAFTAALASYQAAVGSNASFAQRNKTPPPIYVVSAIQNAAVIRLVSRKVGRPFGLPRGRRMIA